MVALQCNVMCGCGHYCPHVCHCHSNAAELMMQMAMPDSSPNASQWRVSRVGRQSSSGLPACIDEDHVAGATATLFTIALELSHWQQLSHFAGILPPSLPLLSPLIESLPHWIQFVPVSQLVAPLSILRQHLFILDVSYTVSMYHNVSMYGPFEKCRHRPLMPLLKSIIISRDAFQAHFETLGFASFQLLPWNVRNSQSKRYKCKH